MRIGDIDYICLTDLAKYVNSEDPSGVIRNWMSNKNSFEYYSLWEEINSINFNSVESHRIKINEVGYNRFTMTPKRWEKDFNAIGIVPSSGKYSIGTYAHPDIAFEFASWLSPEFKLYLIKEFERLKKNEAYQEKVEWHANRLLSKANYVIHTDLLHLVILSNLETINASLISDDISQRERLIKLNKNAKMQMNALKNNKNIKELELLQNQVNSNVNLIDVK